MLKKSNFSYFGIFAMIKLRHITLASISESVLRCRVGVCRRFMGVSRVLLYARGCQCTKRLSFRVYEALIYTTNHPKSVLVGVCEHISVGCGCLWMQFCRMLKTWLLVGVIIFYKWPYGNHLNTCLYCSPHYRHHYSHHFPCI